MREGIPEAVSLCPHALLQELNIILIPVFNPNLRPCIPKSPFPKLVEIVRLLQFLYFVQLGILVLAFRPTPMQDDALECQFEIVAE